MILFLPRLLAGPLLQQFWTKCSINNSSSRTLSQNTLYPWNFDSSFHSNFLRHSDVLGSTVNHISIKKPMLIEYHTSFQLLPIVFHQNSFPATESHQGQIFWPNIKSYYGTSCTFSSFPGFPNSALQFFSFSKLSGVKPSVLFFTEDTRKACKSSGQI